MKSFPKDVTHHLERLVLDIIEWRGSIRRCEIVRRLNDEYARTTIYEALLRLQKKGYVEDEEIVHGIGRPWTEWQLTKGWKIQMALKVTRE